VADRQLAQLLEALDEVQLQGDASVPVSGLAFDSRQVQPGELFVALSGEHSDGHRYLAEAARRGARAAVVERAVSAEPWQALVRVPDSRRALALLAAAFFGYPARHLQVVGITGTNGKTTLTYLLQSIARQAGLPAGVIGTTGASWPGGTAGLQHTTPEAPLLQRLLHTMLADGVRLVLMEASSHALHLQRTLGLDFQVGVFTNLSRDHLDFHGSLDSYAAAKALLFERELARSRAAGRVAVFNRDDPAWPAVVGAWSGRRLAFGLTAAAEIRPAGEPEFSLAGFRCRVETPGGQLQLRGNLPGRHNLENALAAVAVARALGLEGKAIEGGIAACPQVPGRLERVGQGAGPVVLVDYAHTPGALENVLAALRPLVTGRLWVVFGCGGDRDRGKRPLMGRAAVRGADLVVVTSDNPRSEEPAAIISEILPGLEPEGRRLEPGELATAPGNAYCVVEQRRQAIELAVGAARADDVVLIAGKGHEDYQIIGAQRHHFDDREEARCALQRRDGKVD